MAVMTAMLIAAGATAAVGTVLGAKAQADAADQDAVLKRQQAAEVERLAAYKTGLMQEDIQQTLGAQTAALGAAGGHGGSPLLALEDTHMRMQREIVEMNKEAAFRADQLRQGANISSDLAGSYSTAGWIKAGGVILGTASKFYDTPKGATEGLDTGISGPGSRGNKYGGYLSSGSP